MMAGADTSLWPVVVGGLLTGLFALGGIGVGLVGTARRDATQERHEKTKRRADKFEELVAAVYEFDHWVNVITTEEPPRPASPFGKVQSISAVYFPQFSQLIEELNTVSTSYIAWMSEARAKGLSASHPDVAKEFAGVYDPYQNKREDLLDALRKFANDEFQ